MPRGPSVVRTVSTTAMHALMLLISCALPWLVSVPSRSRMICGCCAQHSTFSVSDQRPGRQVCCWALQAARSVAPSFQASSPWHAPRAPPLFADSPQNLRVSPCAADGRTCSGCAQGDWLEDGSACMLTQNVQSTCLNAIGKNGGSKRQCLAEAERLENCCSKEQGCTPGELLMGVLMHAISEEHRGTVLAPRRGNW